MGLSLIAMDWLDPIWIVNVLKVIIALGMVIFVHELGHFLVAKLCGVKCEKFYLGFDIGGWKLWKVQWGETEYGIGVLPLGGYVKMLGQEDNPARYREELERAKLGKQLTPGESVSPTASSASDVPTSGAGETSTVAAGAEAVSLDPRSYLAQSVPKRMAIISAGVVMNVLFALLTAVLAYRIGVDEIACEIGAVSPGASAWQENLKVGDRITEIGGKPVDRFMDLLVAISVGDIADGVPIVYQRPGTAAPMTVRVYPKKLRSSSKTAIGVGVPSDTTINTELPCIPGSAAAKARFQAGDQVIAIDDHPITDYYQIYRALALAQDRPISVTVQRLPDGHRVVIDGTPQLASGKRTTLTVPPMPVRTLGMVMTMGKITAVQNDSPAQTAGIVAGDLITHLDGQPVGDPMTLPERLRKRSWEGAQPPKVVLTVVREGNPAPVKVEVRLRRADWYEVPLMAGSPLSVPAFGIAYDVGNRVVSVIPGGPAARAGVKAGDEIEQGELVPPERDVIVGLSFGKEYLKVAPSHSLKVDLSKVPFGWPAFFQAMQEMLPGGTVVLTLADKRVVKLQPVNAVDWYNPQRGFQFDPKKFLSGGQSMAEAWRLGVRETIESMTVVLRVLKKLGSPQVPLSSLGGPISIFGMAYGAASAGFAELLKFLTLIGANLAVINFLPIPVLDGGHMVFLLYEGITGKPPNEKVHVGLSYLGLFFLLGLMIWVFGLDISRLWPW